MRSKAACAVRRGAFHPNAAIVRAEPPVFNGIDSRRAPRRGRDCMIAYLIAAAIVLAAAWILVRRVRAFFRTRGQSACENCPYSGTCGSASDNGGRGCPKK